MATIQAVEDLRHLVKREQIECELDTSGHLVFARTPAGELRLAALAKLMTRLDLPLEVLDDDALNERISLRRQPGGTGPAAFRLPIAGTLHPVRLLRDIADCVVALGASIFEGARVTAINGKQPLLLEISGDADEVVIATAGYTPELGLMRGRILPIHLQVAVTEPLGPRERKAIRWLGRNRR
jgi:gamma-glutamylputrescine oxidase